MMNFLVRYARGGAVACRGSWAVWAIACCVGWGMHAGAADDLPVDEVPQGTGQQSQWIDVCATFDASVVQKSGLEIHVVEGPEPQREAAAAPPAESPALAALRTQGEAVLVRIAADCGLSEPQRRTLQLAIESDIRRVAADIDAERRKYRGAFTKTNTKEFWQQFRDFQQDVQRCRGWLTNAFDVDSLFTKVLPTTLEPAQSARLTAETDARRAACWKSMVATALVRCDEVVGLDQRQYDAIEAILAERVPLLRVERFADPGVCQHEGQLMVWMALADADWQRLPAGMSKRQIAMLEQLVAQSRVMRPQIEKMGLVEKVSR